LREIVDGVHGKRFERVPGHAVVKITGMLRSAARPARCPSSRHLDVGERDVDVACGAWVRLADRWSCPSQ
jgi:hypothetical protein